MKIIVEYNPITGYITTDSGHTYFIGTGLPLGEVTEESKATAKKVDSAVISELSDKYTVEELLKLAESGMI